MEPSEQLEVGRNSRKRRRPDDAFSPRRPGLLVSAGNTELDSEERRCQIWAVRASRRGVSVQERLTGVGFVSVGYGADADLTYLRWDEESRLTRKVLVDETAVAMYRLAST